STTHSISLFFFFFLLLYGHHRHLHSFPTRRSSDLSSARTELEFGIEISGGIRHALVVLANAHVIAIVKVKISWKHRQFPQDILRSEEYTSELQSLAYLVCRLLLEKKKKKKKVSSLK